MDGCRMASLAAAQDVSRAYGVGGSAVRALASATCSIAPAARIAVVGASGSGKSTLLHLLAGPDMPTSGSVSWPALGQRAELRPALVGMVFQTPSLLPPLSVVENIELPLLLGQASPAVARAAALPCARATGTERARRQTPAPLFRWPGAASRLRPRARASTAIDLRRRADSPARPAHRATRLRRRPRGTRRNRRRARRGHPRSGGRPTDGHRLAHATRRAGGRRGLMLTLVWLNGLLRRRTARVGSNLGRRGVDRSPAGRCWCVRRVKCRADDRARHCQRAGRLAVHSRRAPSHLAFSLPLGR